MVIYIYRERDFLHWLTETKQPEDGDERMLVMWQILSIIWAIVQLLNIKRCQTLQYCDAAL